MAYLLQVYFAESCKEAVLLPELGSSVGQLRSAFSNAMTVPTW